MDIHMGDKLKEKRKVTGRHEPLHAAHVSVFLFYESLINIFTAKRP